jgi:murein DD-endopeptidase MepM/ murein hydrolase activator NlpD
LQFLGRPGLGRPQILACALAALFVVVGSGTALAETSDVPPPPSKPRVQRPGAVAGFRLPFEPGLEVTIHQGWNDPYSHVGRAKYGYDFGLPMYTKVLASASGVVSFVRSGQHGCGGKKFKNRANYVTIDHPDGSSTLYGHLTSISVRVGDVVEVGQVIARSGKTGFSSCQPHLHFERGLQGHFRGLNQSIPVYFEEYPDARLLKGQIVRTAPPCAAPTKGAPDPEQTKAEKRQAARPPIGRFCATYRGLELDSPVLFARLEDAIDYDWAEDGPGGYWLDHPREGFAATWTGQFTIDEPGVYRLEVQASDKVRVRIDGVTLVDAWTELVRPGNIEMAWRAIAGKHTIEVEHVDRSGSGSLHVTWTAQLIDGAWVRWSKAKPEA